jgi:hypothetical protein
MANDRMTKPSITNGKPSMAKGITPRATAHGFRTLGM